MSDLTVRVAEGSLSGVYSSDGAIRIFKGVPYAKPPVGDLRWRPPQPLEAWDGVRAADSFPPAAVQPGRQEDAVNFLGHQKTSEDCLYLNVWTGAGSAKEKRPVLVFIPFGAFVTGTSKGYFYDGEALAKQGVVVVIPNFRLNRFGFLAHPELSRETGTGASGNWGLLDQIAALRWVQRNIEAFGGDPDCVTLCGQSSGSSSVAILMGSPLAKGLFHRAIGQSGGAFETARPNPGYSMLSRLGDTEEDGVRLMRSLGAASLAELRTKPAQAILDALRPEGPLDWTKGMINPIFVCGYPCIDGHVIPSDGLRAVYGQGRQHDVPLITGSTANEGAGKNGARTVDTFRAHARAEYGDLADRFLQLFPVTTDTEAKAASTLVFGDQLFSWQNWTWARLNSRSSKQKTFYYHFERIPPYPADARYPEAEGLPAKVALRAMHSMDIQYIFRNLHTRPHWGWEPVDHRLSETMSGYWVNFAKTGDPNGGGLPRWPAFDGRTAQAMIFGDETRAAAAPDQERLNFWDAYFAREDQKFAR